MDPERVGPTRGGTFTETQIAMVLIGLDILEINKTVPEHLAGTGDGGARWVKYSTVLKAVRKALGKRKARQGALAKRGS